MSHLETYLHTLTHQQHAVVAETGHYAALQTLLNAIGASARPRVTAIIHPRDTGAGIPDLALFDEHQPVDQPPARGIIEAKGVESDLMAIARGPQVARYVAHYGQALVTNYYQFVLVTRQRETGLPVYEERYDLAADAASFWGAAAHPRALARVHETGLTEYLLRAMRRSAPLTSPADVAWMLASYAREARARIESGVGDVQALNVIRQQLEGSLGVRFEGETAQDFFRSTLVQTLFYGLFSAWVLWHETHPAARTFDLWRDTRRLNIPVISELFSQFSSANSLSLSVEQILEWTTAALNRVDRALFFAAFNKGAAVQYFYEPFLEAFDPELRRQLGVWYTPPEVVDYMVDRVDAALKHDLGIPDGLADPSVYVLDPCCGTGAYLVAVLRRIHATLRGRDGDMLAAQAAGKAMRERVFGFEILPAPFVVAHLQIGILLNGLRAPLRPAERAGVYLTNALTGWEASDAPKTLMLFPELRAEREAAEAVKRSRPILVILGNPPYSGYAGLAIDEERALTEAYRTTQHPALPRPQGQGLNDLYVRFYRMAERQIAETTQRGVVCFISNYSWLDGLSHPGMRERYLQTFDRIVIDNLHGDRMISEVAPDGRSSETVFAMRGSSTGIRVGTAITTLIRTPGPPTTTPRATLYYHDWTQARADERRLALLNSIRTDNALDRYQVISPSIALGLPFKPRVMGADYLSWPKLTDLFPAAFPGVQTKRDEALISIDRGTLVDRITKYFDPGISDEQIRSIAPRLMENANRFNAKQIRDYLLKRGFLPQNVVRYCYRPFDNRWIYWEPETKLLGEKSPDYFPHVQPGNLWIEARQKQSSDKFDRGTVVSVLADNFGNGFSSFIPLYLYPTAEQRQMGLFDGATRRPNLSKQAIAYLEAIGLNADSGAEPLFFHALATLHAPAYRTDNAGALRQDWPRVPLPATRARLEESAALGRQVAALLDVDSPVSGVTHGEVRPDLAGIGVLATLNGAAPDFTIAVRWGYFGAGSAVMPGRGKVVESDGGALDVHLNDTTVWGGVPSAVWEYTLGGYQVLKKWLSYREAKVLGRAITAEEAREFMHIARRIAALLALSDALDAGYRA